MRQLIRCVSCCLVIQSAAWSADAPLPPTQQWLQVDPAGEFQLVSQVTVCKCEPRTRTVTKTVPETTTVSDTVDGKVVTRNVTMYREVTEEQAYSVCIPVLETVSSTLPQESFDSFDVSGAVLDEKKLRQRVGDGRLVLILPSAGRLPAIYSSLFRPETVVLVQKSRTSGPPSAVPPEPASQPTTSSLPVPKFPASPAPEFVVLARQGVDDIAVRRSFELTTSVTSSLMITKGQAHEQLAIPLQRTLRQLETTIVPARHLRFFLERSQEVTFDQAKERLSSEVAALYAVDGNTVDPFWLQNLKPSSLVLVGPRLPGEPAALSALAAMTAPLIMPSSAVSPPAPVVPVPVAP